MLPGRDLAWSVTGGALGCTQRAQDAARRKNWGASRHNLGGALYRAWDSCQRVHRAPGVLVGRSGFPALFAAMPVVQALGLRGGLGEYAALVSLTFLLNGILWGAVLGVILSSPAAPNGHGD